MKKFGSAVILCGGKSRRMGFDKCNIKINGVLLIQTIAEQLNEIFDEILLITNDSNSFRELGYIVKEDIKKNQGPAGGIYTGLKAANSQYVFFTACDMPVINREYICYMMERIERKEQDGILSKKGEWIEPLYAFYSKNMIGTFLQGIEGNNLKLFEIIKKSKIEVVEECEVKRFSKNLDIFTNLNYVEDLDALKKIYGGGVEIDEL